MFQRTTYMTVDNDDLIECLQSELSKANLNNEEMVIRELVDLPGQVKLVMDFKEKVNLDLSLAEKLNLEEVVDKIQELEIKRDYWFDLLEKEDYVYNFKDTVSRNYEHFNGAITALKYILKINTI